MSRVLSSIGGAQGLVRISGLLVLVWCAVLLFVMPSTPAHEVPQGFTSPVVGLELASEPEHVEAILGEQGHPRRGEIVRAMDLGNRLDFFFLASYSSLHASLALLARERGLLGRATSSLLFGLAAAMAVGDALENLCLLTLSSLTDPEAMQGPLAWLRATTLLKWGAIYVSSGLLARPLWRDRSALRFASIPFGLALSLGAASVLWLPLLEVGSLAVGLGWLVALLASLLAGEVQ